MQARFTDLILRYPARVIILSLILVSLASLGVRDLELEADSASMMDDDYPGKIEHDQIQDDFTASNNLQIIISHNEQSSSDQQQPAVKNRIFSSDVLSVIRQLTEDAWRTPYVARVDSISNYQHIEANGDDLEVNSLLPLELAITDEAVQKVQAVALSTPTLRNQLVAASGNLAVINVDVNVPDDVDNYVAYGEVTNYVEDLLVPLKQQHADLKFGVMGNITTDYASTNYAFEDMRTLIPLMLLIIVILLALMLRSLTATLAGLFIVIIIGLTTMGLVGWLGITLDAASSISPIVVMTLAVADVVHLLVGVFNGKRLGKNKHDAIAYSLNLNIAPIFLTSLTTGLGVITFSFSDYPSIRILGVVISIGVSVAFVLTVTLLPALLSYLPIDKRVPEHRTSALMYRYVAWLLRLHRPILLCGGVLCVLLASQAWKNTLNESPELFFRSWSPERQTIDLMKQELGGVVRFEVAVYTETEDAMTTPEFLQDVADFSEWLRSQRGVGHVNTFTDVYKRLNKNMHGGDEQWYRLPETRELASQYLLLYELSLPYGLDIAYQVNQDKSATRVFVTISDIYAAELVELRNDIKSWFQTRNPEVRIGFAGTNMMMNVLTIESLMVSLMQGGAIAFLMISLVMLLAFKSWRYGVVGVLANLFPVAMGYGVWAHIDGIANFAVMCVAGVCLGVVIDFAVHFLSKYRFARIDQQSPEDAVRIAFEKVALPLWTTTVVLVLGFGVLIFSSITLNASMGLLTGIIILLAFIFDVLVLPAMLLCMESKNMNRASINDKRLSVDPQDPADSPEPA